MPGPFFRVTIQRSNSFDPSNNFIISYLGQLFFSHYSLWRKFIISSRPILAMVSVMVDIIEDQTDLNKIANSLTPSERLALAKILESLNKDDGNPGQRTSIMELRGLGKEEWKDTDVDEYIDQEREEWEK
jgi:hypothetical protein